MNIPDDSTVTVLLEIKRPVPIPRTGSNHGRADQNTRTRTLDAAGGGFPPNLQTYDTPTK